MGFLGVKVVELDAAGVAGVVVGVWDVELSIGVGVVE